MQLTKLFSMQRELDSFIQNNRDEQTDVFLEKGLALLVELAELANETRCFKFWSYERPIRKYGYFGRVRETLFISCCHLGLKKV